jgi:cysteine synthase A
MKANSILESIGKTPHVRLAKLFPNHEVWVKDERRNPGGSIKDRIALAMVEDAEKSGLLKSGGVIVEPTSGNTGIGLAIVGAVKGYRVIFTMPESMSIERRKLLKAYGAELVLTPREKGMKGAVEQAKEIVSNTPNAWMPMQFENASNPAIHYRTTAKEIFEDFPKGFDYLVCGVGTGGHISGVGKALKELFPKIRIIAVEPADSPVLSGGQPGPHPIQGIGAGFIPKNYSAELVDQIVTISKQETFEMINLSAKVEGILAGISSNANLAALKKILNQIPKDSKVLTFAYDSGERYLSVDGIWD